jgi:hypothetical protein
LEAMMRVSSPMTITLSRIVLRISLKIGREVLSAGALFENHAVKRLIRDLEFRIRDLEFRI